MNFLKLTFFICLVYGSFIGWSSNNWIMIWLIMEICFVFFIGFISVNMSYGIVELVMKYYIIQVFISLCLISLLLVWAFNLHCYGVFYLIIILMMKLGMVPFHFWIIMVVGKLNWFSFFVMTSFMKLLPILMFYYLTVGTNINVILVMSVMGGSILGLSNLMIQKLMGYSSLVHLCWLILSLSFALKMFFIYFSCYLAMTFVLTLIFNSLGIYYVNQFKLVSGSVFSKFLVFFLVLSLGGFPPFMGFVIKWVLVSCLLLFHMKFLLTVMVVFSLFSVVFYLELFFYIMMASSIKVCWYSSDWEVLSGLVFVILGFYGVLLFYF